MKNVRGIKIGDDNINNMRYVYDTILKMENESNLQELINKITEESI